MIFCWPTKSLLSQILSAQSFSVLFCWGFFFAVMPFNHRCTYKAELSEGSEQEKASYILTTKQKVVKLIGQWVALYGPLLKEDPIAMDFLEVRLQHCVLCWKIIFVKRRINNCAPCCWDRGWRRRWPLISVWAACWRNFGREGEQRCKSSLIISQHLLSQPNVSNHEHI